MSEKVSFRALCCLKVRTRQILAAELVGYGCYYCNGGVAEQRQVGHGALFGPCNDVSAYERMNDEDNCRKAPEPFHSLAEISSYTGQQECG